MRKIILHSAHYSLDPFFSSDGIERWNESMQYDDDDLIICCVYWHLYSIDSILVFDNCEDALLNTDFSGKHQFIFTKQNKSILTRKNSILLLYNSWETREIDTRISKLQLFVDDFLNLPRDKVVFSTSSYWNHNSFSDNLVINYDWQFILEKRAFNTKNIVSSETKKRYRILSLNHRANLERYAYCLYLNKEFRSKVAFSYLGSLPKIGDSKLSKWVQDFGEEELSNFNKSLPRVIDDPDPDQHQTQTIVDTIESSYVFLSFEVNKETNLSNAQQISEKSYKAIRSGRPFIVFTRRGGLMRHLKRQGFQTFSPFISEEYDNPELPYFKRFLKLIEVTKTLCEYSEDEMAIIDQKMRSRVTHNLNWLKSTDNVGETLFHKISKSHFNSL